MYDNGIKELLKSRRNKATTDSIRFDTRSDDMKRIIEYAKKKDSHGGLRGSQKDLQIPKLQQEQEYRFELSVDGVRVVINSTLSEAQNKLQEMTYKNSYIG